MPEKLERLCFNCNSFFPDTYEATEYGICLAEEVFEPFLDDLLIHGNFDNCRSLVQARRFEGERKVCSLYEEAEMWEVPDDISPDLIDQLILQAREEKGRKPTEYFFKDHSFAWLLEHDEQLQKLRHRYQHRSPEERRMAADHEYHAAIACQHFLDLTEEHRQTAAIPGEVAALAIDPHYAPALLTVGTYEYLLGRINEGVQLLLSLVCLPIETEDLAVIIDKAGRFLQDRKDFSQAEILYAAAIENFPDVQLFKEGHSCTDKQRSR